MVGLISKRIYTLRFDRSDGADSGILFDLLTKLKKARAEHAIVITTPGVVKSLFLKYLKTLKVCLDTYLAAFAQYLKCDFFKFLFLLGYIRMSGICRSIFNR